jgi:hypothetical protein
LVIGCFLTGVSVISLYVLNLLSQKPVTIALENAIDVGPMLDGIWTGYPQSRFPNWTERQVKKAKIYDVVHKNVNDEGFFTHPKEVIGVHGI